MNLSVLLHGAIVAHVERTSGTYRLRYTSTYGRRSTMPPTPLSFQFPVSGQLFTGPEVERFLWSLLPESDSARSAAARMYGVQAGDPLSLLGAIGKDCAGAIQLCSADEVSAVLSDQGDLLRASDGDIEQRLANLRMLGQASWIMEGEHWSLPGMQEKFAIRRQGDRWWWATGSQPTTHIVKPGVLTAKHQALVEHLSMRAAAILGLDVASTRFLDFKSERAIVVERFDRTWNSDGGLTRHHQEDLCQALGVAEKYESRGGPCAIDLIEVLRDASASPAQARRNVARFVAGLIFNTIVAAPDAHARNYSVRLQGDDVDLTPLYDVATGLAYDTRGESGRELSMSIGGEFDAEKIGRAQWGDFARAARLDPDAVLTQVDATVDSVAAAFRQACSELRDADWDRQLSEVSARLLPRLDQHIAALKALQ